MVLEIPTTLIDFSKFDNSISSMMHETINNMLIELYANLAQTEIEKKEKRQREGIEQKRLRGDWDDYGRPRVMPLDKFAFYYSAVEQGRKRPFQLMHELKMTRTTFYRYIHELKQNKGNNN